VLPSPLLNEKPNDSWEVPRNRASRTSPFGSPLTLSPLQRIYHNDHNDEVERRLFQYLVNFTQYAINFDYVQNAEERAIALSAIRN